DPLESFLQPADFERRQPAGDRSSGVADGESDAACAPVHRQHPGHSGPAQAISTAAGRSLTRWQTVPEPVNWKLTVSMQARMMKMPRPRASKMCSGEVTSPLTAPGSNPGPESWTVISMRSG